MVQCENGLMEHSNNETKERWINGTGRMEQWNNGTGTME